MFQVSIPNGSISCFMICGYGEKGTRGFVLHVLWSNGHVFLMLHVSCFWPFLLDGWKEVMFHVSGLHYLFQQLPV